MSLLTIIDDVKEILQDASYADGVLIRKINQAVSRIAAGVRMPDGIISPALPDLFAYGTVNTAIDLPYVSLPATYQRNVTRVYDSSGNVINPPSGGGYSAFALFMRQISDLRLTESGPVYRVAVKGSNLYYQGIPTAAETIGLHFYRKPVDMVDGDDLPDGIPEHLQNQLIKHYVLKEIFGEAIEDGQDSKGSGMKYHTAKFFEAMTDLVDYVGIDATPEYYGSGGGCDAGACD
jgi:hypothetical protein